VRTEKKRKRISSKLKGAVVRRDENSCIACGVNKKLAFHHIKPVNEGGKNEMDNIVLLCRSCHNLTHLNYLSIKPYRNDFKLSYKDPGIKNFTAYLYAQKRDRYLKNKYHCRKNSQKDEPFQFQLF